MLKAVGFTDDDLKKPLIGIANTWIEIGPCNFHLRDLAEHVKAGIRAAGGTPMEFNTVSISDGITMGTEGMRASLISREVIADSIELVARGNCFDGLVCLVGCDKTIPGGMMALARCDIPGLVLYGGSIAPGTSTARTSRFRTCSRRSARTRPARSTTKDFMRSKTPPARAPAPAAASSPPTPWRPSGVPRHLAAGLQRHPGRRRGEGPGARPLRRTGDGARPAATSRPSQIITRQAIENAIAVGGGDRRLDQRRAAPAGDREGSGRRARDRRFRRDQRARRRSSPTSSPAGLFVATDLHPAGGISLLCAASARGGLPSRRLR